LCRYILGESLLHFLELYGHEVDLTRATIKPHALAPVAAGAGVQREAGAGAPAKGLDKSAEAWVGGGATAGRG